MRILYFGSFVHDWDTESYIARALARAGADVHCVDERGADGGDLYREIRDSDYDVFLFAKYRPRGEWDQSGGALRALVAELDCLPRRPVVACWVFDLLAKEYSPERFRWAQAVDETADVFFLTDGYTAQQLKRAVVLRQGVPDDVRPGVPFEPWRKDVLWLGGVYRDRREQAEQLQRHFGRRLLFVPDGVRGGRLADLMASVGVVIGPNYPAFPEYWSNRIYVVAGYGGFFLAPEIQGMGSEGWTPGVHYAAYTKQDDLPALAEAWLAKPQERAAIAGHAARFAAEQFSYDARVRTLLDKLQEIKGTNNGKAAAAQGQAVD